MIKNTLQFINNRGAGIHHGGRHVGHYESQIYALNKDGKVYLGNRDLNNFVRKPISLDNLELLY